MKAFYKNDSWYNNLEKVYDRKFKSINIVQSTIIIYRYISDYDNNRNIYASIQFSLDGIKYEFTNYFDVELSEEDFEIELDKVMRKWYKIINEIITRIECYEIEEKDYDKL